jgi:hypothetical protein
MTAAQQATRAIVGSGEDGPQGGEEAAIVQDTEK